MQLNIYLISHPIIKKLTNDIIYNNEITKDTTYNNRDKTLGFLIIYEILRKYIKIDMIYIKKINYIKEVCTFNRDQSFVIITDIAKSYNMITDAVNLFPEVYIQNIYLDHNQIISNNLKINKVIKNRYNKNTQIFVIQSNLDNYSILQILDNLIVNTNVEINTIKLICITCNNRIIEKIGKKYPNLNVYTSKIIAN